MDEDDSSLGIPGRSVSRKSFDAGSVDAATQRLKLKQNVCDKVLKRLREAGADGIDEPHFAEELEAHFKRLPTRYALDVNTERAEDVLTHKRLLEEACSPDSSLAFYVRPVHVLTPNEEEDKEQESIDSHYQVVDQPADAVGQSSMKNRAFHPPAFGSNPSLETMVKEGAEGGGKDMSISSQQNLSPGYPHLPMHEVTFSTRDRPKLLSHLSSVLADVGLNIREAHVFSTADGFSLDVFVVDGWPSEETEDLMSGLQNALHNMENATWARSGRTSPMESPARTPTQSAPAGKQEGRVQIPNDGQDDWEIDSSQLVLQNKIASGSFGDLYRGTYCGQDVAIKILKAERLNDNLQHEFAQEVFIMRKIRHKNVVQFIGACTKPPNLSIVTEYMPAGSVYDWLHKQKLALRLPTVLRIALDVARGMDFLHKNNIIHRDLKAANLLMNENEVVKVADFGVARVQANTGIMTAETGTYRWMAPEVIEHRPYTNKADLYSFGVVLWELLTGKLPYADLTPLQAAVNVVQKNLRPPIPRQTHPAVVSLMERCWSTNPALRPDFAEVVRELQDLLREVEDDTDSSDPKKDKKKGFFSSLKRVNPPGK